MRRAREGERVRREERREEEEHALAWMEGVGRVAVELFRDGVCLFSASRSRCNNAPGVALKGRSEAAGFLETLAGAAMQDSLHRLPAF
jgi:hypothetical protein